MKPIPLNEALKAARKSAGMTQAQVAEKCGWDAPTRYSNYEQGTREPTLADLHAIARAVALGGHSFARIVLGEDVIPASQLERLAPEMILHTIQRMRETTQKVEGEAIDVEADPELFAELLRLTILENRGDSGERRVQPANRSGGRAIGAKGKAEAGDAPRIAAGGKRRRA